MPERPMVKYLSFALMMVAQLPQGDPARSLSERMLLGRLEIELVSDDEDDDDDDEEDARPWASPDRARA